MEQGRADVFLIEITVRRGALGGPWGFSQDAEFEPRHVSCALTLEAAREQASWHQVLKGIIDALHKEAERERKEH